ncbi:Putative PBSX repressor [Anaerohalosphaera lusitana]|uniref:Putative PBSX repressor n=1 Tax=Anaerohalosphaera lusitana TaxID=1936003 RepID=A0A1U9NH13_9BACT|nr:XRE family transcriptional regulator [Anaerohalosphaera lusitana]AQT67223.1 Putative PBSX repressor [Anaerohalosphaera lusitana]
MPNIAEKLKHLRISSGLTQKQVTDRTGIDDSRLSEYENGRSEPRLGILAKLADVYGVTLDSLFSAQIEPELRVLWRNEPQNKRDIQQEFLTYCRQYHQLEMWTNSKVEKKLPYPEISARRFHYQEVADLAAETRSLMGLGNRPGQTLFSILQEVYGVKIFHLDLEDAGIAACTVSEEFGPAIALNCNCPRWRRNHDIAHELFHILTWEHFGHSSEQLVLTDQEEKYATCFAGNLLMPEETVKAAVNKATDDSGKVSFNRLEMIAREFDVTLESLIWRLHYVYNFDLDETKSWIERSKNLVQKRARDKGEKPELFPERYKALAIGALLDGQISIGKFARFMQISRSAAKDYLSNESIDYAEMPVTNF